MNENIENNLEVNNVDEKYMKIALQEAKKAYDNNEVPIGCVIVYNDEVEGQICVLPIKMYYLMQKL